MRKITGFSPKQKRVLSWWADEEERKKYDAVICDGAGEVILCSDALFGCEHQGLHVNRDYMNKVIANGIDRATGIILIILGASVLLVNALT